MIILVDMELMPKSVFRFVSSDGCETLNTGRHVRVERVAV